MFELPRLNLIAITLTNVVLFGTLNDALRHVQQRMHYVRDGEIQGRSSVFLKVHCPCILPSLT